jgi:hypothetical protein
MLYYLNTSTDNTSSSPGWMWCHHTLMSIEQCSFGFRDLNSPDCAIYDPKCVLRWGGGSCSHHLARSCDMNIAQCCSWSILAIKTKTHDHKGFRLSDRWLLRLWSSGMYYSKGFEVLTAVVMKSTISWDITPCSPLRVNRRFRGTYRLPWISACHLLSHWFLGWLILWPWRWRRYVPLKRRLTFNSLHSIISQTTVLFTTV